MLDRFNNSQGKIFYGMHFYPGVCRYEDKSMDVYWSEDTIRKIGPSFRARPVFLEHVDDVNENIDELRKEVDGWVVRSFFNEADGKHWAEFLVCTDRAERAISNGYAVSNCFIAEQYGPAGTASSVPYDAEIVDAYYEHLAIVKTPRYEESIILTPEEFKKYNDDKLSSLAKYSNSKNKKKERSMLTLFKKEKMKNSAELQDASLILPVAKKEYSVMALVDLAEKYEKEKGKPRYVNAADMVKVGEDEMTFSELLKKFKMLESRVAELEAGEEDEDEVDDEPTDEDFANEEDDSDDDSGDEESFENKEDEEECYENQEDDAAEDELKKAKLKDKKQNKMKNGKEKVLTPREAALKKREEKRKHQNSKDKEAAKKKADALRDAPRKHQNSQNEAPVTYMDGVERGKTRYGS